VNAFQFNQTATANFWWYFPALLTDSKRVHPIAPVHCSGEMCNSFFIPGSMPGIKFDPSQPNITKQDYSNAIAYIQEDAPGYHVEFYPIDTENDPSLSLSDCRVYGISFMAVQVCLKKVNHSMLAGILNISRKSAYISLACMS
jgi:hypothetical protein